MAPKPKHQKTAKGKDGMKIKDDMDVTIKLDHCPLSFSNIFTIDHEYSLPKYAHAACRPDGAITMEDVDRIQLELEALLSASTIRRKTLSAELRLLHGLDKKRGRPPASVSGPGGPGSPGKAGRSGERPIKKFKDSFGRPKEPTPVKPPPKIRSSTGAYNSEDILPQIKADTGTPVPTVKNDIPDKFWAAMEAFCGPITAKDVEMLERLSTEQEDTEDYLTVPPLGKHYTLKWAEEDDDDTDSDSEGENKSHAKHKHKSEEGSSLGPLTQRLVSGLVDDGVLTALDENADGGGKETDPVVVRPGMASAAAQLERRIKRELESCGLVDDTDGPTAVEGDEVLAELERCQARLRTLATHNAAQLERLLRLGRAELRRQQLREKLAATDLQVQEAYQVVAAARQRKKSPSKKERDAAWKALKDRDVIIKMLDTL